MPWKRQVASVLPETRRRRRTMEHHQRVWLVCLCVFLWLIYQSYVNEENIQFYRESRLVASSYYYCCCFFFFCSFFFFYCFLCLGWRLTLLPPFIGRVNRSYEWVVSVTELIMFSLQTNRSGLEWNRAETTSSRRSRLACFIPHPSAIAVFRYAQTNRSLGETLPVSEQWDRSENAHRPTQYDWMDDGTWSLSHLHL